MADPTEKAAGVEALKPYLSPVSVWALSVGAAVGWGSLIVTSTSYLSQAGPMGSVLGILIGAVLMLMVSVCFGYLARQFPEAGGVYAYTKRVFGYDRAFLVSWFLGLTYIAIFWANATALPLFARYFLKNFFSFGKLYTVFGYDVYLGEVLLTLTAIGLVTWLCIRSKQNAARAMVVLAVLFTVGITVCFAAAMIGHGKTGFSFAPMFLPDGHVLRQIIRIVFITPWAFIGFESITHSVEEITFKTKRISRILVISVITTTALYIFITLLSVTAYPAGSGSWMEYITHLDAYEGIEGLPAFFAARHYLGDFGVYLLMASLLSLVITSLIANLRALGRLFYSVARDGILPARFAELNKKQIPQNALLLVALISLPIPFLGRTAIGWIVDVSTIGATILYGFVSAAAYKTARANGRRKVAAIGGVTFCVMMLFGAFLLLPGLFSFGNSLASETYILIMVWSIMGFFYFRRIIAKDHARRFGKAIIVWIALLALIVFMALTWTGQRDEAITREAVVSVQHFYEGTAGPEAAGLTAEEYVEEQMDRLHRTNVMNTLLVSGMFALAMGAMLINHFSLRKWESQTAQERDRARDVAYKDPLTGVKSKHAYVEYERDMAEKIYRGDAGEFAVVVCDVNGLKHINDTLGHQAGDQYIRAASDLICESFKHSPVFRIGGDEFAILLKGQDFDNRNEILAALNERIEKNIGTGSVVASLGMTEFDPRQDNTFHAVFTRADGLMYQRKMELKSMGARVRE